MLESLLDILGELLGLGGNEPPPRRTPAQRPQTPPADAPAVPTPTQLNPAQMQQLRERMEAKLRSGGQQIRKPARRKTPEVEILPEPKPAMTTMSAADFISVLASQEAPVPPSAASSPRFDFVAALRANPAAARQAFVYSEIFGKPLADR